MPFFAFVPLSLHKDKKRHKLVFVITAFSESDEKYNFTYETSEKLFLN